MKKPKKRRESGGSADMSARIAELDHLLWGGNEAQMAKDLGVSQPVLWRVVHGTQTPPGRLIENLGQDPRINPAWLLRGEGEPTGPESGQGIAIPIAKQLLPGLPQDHHDYLSPETFALSPSLYRRSRYWFEVQPGDPVLRSRLRINARDLLLMDADRREIPSQERLYQRLCGVKMNGAMKLGLVDYFEGNEDSGPPRLEVDTFDVGVDPSEVRSELVKVKAQGRPREIRNFYRLVPDKTGKKVKVSVSDHELNPILPTIAPAGIVCIAVLMVRRSPA